jgi:MFS family permease
MSPRVYPRLTLALLTGLNFLNYIDRSVLFAVQPLIRTEPGFQRGDADYGLLTTAFFICYMVTAPVFGFLADRFPRRPLIVLGALVWSSATLLTAVTYDFRTLFLRHMIVGIGEASFVAIAPSYIADLFEEGKRGRMLSIFYIAIAAGTAAGYIIGGSLGQRYGWRVPFYVAAGPGFILGMLMYLLPEPQRGVHDTVAETSERSSVLGLTRNGAYLTATFAMAMLTFALGGLSQWMPTFLSRVRGISLEHANFLFGVITLFNGIVATLLGGWVGDRALRRNPAGYYVVSAGAVLIAIPVMSLAIYSRGVFLFPAIFLAEFFLFFNTGPLNAALVDSVSARIRASAIAVNLFLIHLLGDAFSPPLIGYVSDKTHSLQTGFLPAIAAVVVSLLILLYGIRYAPQLKVERQKTGVSA